MPALDGIRGIAVLMVMLSHYCRNHFGGTPMALEPLLRYGNLGVDLFFVLSGFLITGILIDTRDRPAYFKTFYIRRFFRIFPLYYLALAVTFGGGAVLMTAGLLESSPGVERAYRDQWWLWTYLGNVRIAMLGEAAFGEGWLSLNHFWTLAIEEHFYLVWPLVVWLIPNRWLGWTIAVGIGVAILFRGAMLGIGADPVANLVLTPGRMDSLLAGAGLAWLVRRGWSINRLALFGFAAAAAAIVVAAGLLLLTRLAGDSLPGPIRSIADTLAHLSNQHPAYQLLGFTAVALGFAGLIAVALASGRFNPVAPIARLAVLRFFGKYSYGLYVWHHIPNRLFRRWELVGRLQELTGSDLLGRLAFIGLAGGSATLCALLSWHLFEKHFLKLKDRFPYGRRRVSGFGRPDAA
jgi:peptidoglycan/LPS O-acetylase OafA/YrhL